MTTEYIVVVLFLFLFFVFFVFSFLELDSAFICVQWKKSKNLYRFGKMVGK